MFDRPTGRIDSTSIYSGKSLTDVLIFEPPVRDIQYLNLELPGKNVGVDSLCRQPQGSTASRWACRAFASAPLRSRRTTHRCEFRTHAEFSCNSRRDYVDYLK